LDECQAAFSPDARWLAFAEWKQPTRIWDLQARAIAHEIPDAPEYIAALAFDRSGRLVAAGGYRGEILIHDVTTAQTVATWTGHPMAVTGLCFTPDGTRLASASKDGNVKLWDTARADEVLTLRGHATFDTTVAFSPDGQMCVVGGWDGYLRAWSIKSPSADAPESWDARRRIWHRRHADAATQEKSQFRIAHHYEQLAILQPEDWRHRVNRARALAELGQWDLAASDYDTSMRHPDSSSSPYYERALLYLRAGDEAGYRTLCDRMWEVLSKRQDTFNRNNLVWACALTPNSPISPDKMVALLEQTLPRTSAQDRRTVLSTLGSALYRAGRYPEALARFEESVKLDTRGGILEDFVFLALVHHRLGDADKSREFLARADKEVEHIRATNTRSRGDAVPSRTRTQVELLYKEAKSALGD
jgi:tetratricopeptide (TPR) repeat protein